MRYFVMIVMMAFGLSALAADVGALNSRSVKYRCSFHDYQRKGMTCQAWGEVCVSFGSTTDNTSVPGCDSSRDDNHLRISCTNGFEDHSRVLGERSGDDLVIKSVGRDDERIVIDGFSHRDDNHHGKDTLRARLSFGRNDRDDNEPRGRFVGACRVSLQHDYDLDFENEFEAARL